jgi:hypothetical protein
VGGPVLICGRVLTAEGEPVAAAAVYFVRGPVALPDVAQVTGADGGFSLTAPVPGRYRVGVNAPGAPAVEREVTAGDASGVVEFRLGTPPAVG